MTKVILISVVALFLFGCGAGKDKTNVEVFQGMFDQNSFKAQDWDPDGSEIVNMKYPPQGTLPRDHKPYPYGPADAEEAGLKLKNPYVGQVDAEFLSQGKKRFDVYCAVCHGPKGLGQGSVIEKMILKPPSLVTQKVKDMPDGRIYHIIMRGQGLMGHYANQLIHEKDRWAVINYIRSLQEKN